MTGNGSMGDTQVKIPYNNTYKMALSLPEKNTKNHNAPIESFLGWGGYNTY